MKKDEEIDGLQDQDMKEQLKLTVTVKISWKDRDHCQFAGQLFQKFLQKHSDEVDPGFMPKFSIK